MESGATGDDPQLAARTARRTTESAYRIRGALRGTHGPLLPNSSRSFMHHHADGPATAASPRSGCWRRKYASCIKRSVGESMLMTRSLSAVVVLVSAWSAAVGAQTPAPDPVDGT